MTNAVRAQEAMALQAIRDQQIIEELQIVNAEKETARLNALNNDLEYLGVGVGGANIKTQNKKVSIIACTIRNTGFGWAVLDDENHSPVNVQSVSVVADPENFKILVTHNVDSNNSVSQQTIVNSLVAVPDETFASQGLIVGASVGTTSSALRASANLAFRTYGRTGIADITHFFDNKVNIESLANNTGFRATVPQLQEKAITITKRHTDSRSIDYAVNLVNDTQFDVVAYADLDCYCFYNAGVWTFTTDSVLTTLTAVWNTDTLTITHDTCGKTFLSAFLTQVYGGYRPVLVSSNANSFSVKFVNDSGVVQTSLSSAFKFYFARPHKYPCLMPSANSLYVNCGRALVYWDDVVNANGNIWIFGTMSHES